MFKRNNQTTPPQTVQAVERITSVLGSGLIWHGSINGSGGVRIEGAFEGEIALRGGILDVYGYGMAAPTRTVRPPRSTWNRRISNCPSCRPPAASSAMAPPSGDMVGTRGRRDGTKTRHGTGSQKVGSPSSRRLTGGKRP